MLDRRTISGLLLGFIWVIGIYWTANITFEGLAVIMPLAMAFLAPLILYLKHKQHRLTTGISIGLMWCIGIAFGDILTAEGFDNGAAPWFFAALITLMVVVYPAGTQRTEEKTSKTVEVPKRKRQIQTEDEKMRLLWELMDEDERIAFKETLKERMLARYDRFDDGEIPYDLYDMLNDEQAYQQTR